MKGVGRRIGVLAAVLVAAVPLAIAASAFACANLFSLKLDRAAGTPGTQVSAVGRNFNTNPAASPVQIRFNSRNGRVLWEGRPEAGKVRGRFAIPNARPGQYVIVATQLGPNGRPAAGSPGRAPLRVRSSSGSSGAVPVAPWSPRGDGPAPQGAPIVTPAVLGGAGVVLGLLGVGIAFVATSRRRRLSPAPSAS